jgi:phosphoglycerate kinase
MANTFLTARGFAVGRSMQKPDLRAAARDVLERTRHAGCKVILPEDAVVTAELAANATAQIVPVKSIPDNAMVLGRGPATVHQLVAALHHAGVAERLSYVSTAGGAFLEWLEGRTLPGVAALAIGVPESGCA